MNKKLRMIVIIGVIATALLGCTVETSQYSPEQVINNALDETDSLGSYYAESEWTSMEKGKLVSHNVSKEWRSVDGRMRNEFADKDGSNLSITVNDSNSLLIYNVEEKQAYYIVDDPEILGFNQPSPREQANTILEMLHETHEISVEGEEKILGRPSFHLVAKAKEDYTHFGDMEIWIDKDNWMTLKTISVSGDIISEILYTEIDFDVKIPDDIFTLNLPKDVEVIDFDDIYKKVDVTLEEALKSMDRSFLYFPESNGWKITKVEMTETEGKLNRNEISIDYQKDDLPLLTMSAFKSLSENVGEEFDMPGEELVTIRNQAGAYSDFVGIRSLFWQEDGLTYSIMLFDPNMALEDLIEFTDQMVLMK